MLNNLALPLPQIEDRLRATIASSHLDSHMSDVYEILRAVGVVDRSIVGDYFDRCLDLLQNDPGEVKRLAVRYSTLFNIYTGFYKNRDFERRVTELIAESLVETTIPRDFADYLSVYLSFNSRLTEVGGRKRNAAFRYRGSVADPGCLSRISDPGSRIRLFSIPDPGSELSPSRIPDPGSS
jgi:hypothetical protein